MKLAPHPRADCTNPEKDAIIRRILSRGEGQPTKLLKRIAGLLLVLTVLLQSTGALAADTIPQPTLSPEAAAYDSEHPEDLEANQLYAASAILIEADSGKVIFEKDPDAVRYPASTTKIMTIMLGIMMVDPSSYDNTVIVSERAVDVPEDSSTMDLKAGEEIRYMDLLYGTMLLSANDGCNVIAETVSGSIEAFVDLMNQYAAELGCTSTHFANPHGYHDDNHYTTARDLAIIAQAAMKLDVFRQIAGTKETTIPATNLSRKRRVTSTNQLLQTGTEESPNKYYYADAIGIKTGQHSMAGYCFVGCAQRDGVELISVVLYTGNRARWADTIKLMDYGFSQYTSVTIPQLFAMNPLTIETSGYALDDSGMGKLELKCVPQDAVASANTTIVDTFENIESMAANLKKITQIQYTRDFAAPIESGEVIGTMTYYPEGETEPLVYDLVASRTVNKRENAPKTLAQIIAEVNEDPNPLPPISAELVIVYILLPAAAIVLLLRLLRKRLLKRRRTRRMSHLRRYRHFRR